MEWLGEVPLSSKVSVSVTGRELYYEADLGLKDMLTPKRHWSNTEVFARVCV